MSLCQKKYRETDFRVKLSLHPSSALNSIVMDEVTKYIKDETQQCMI